MRLGVDGILASQVIEHGADEGRDVVGQRVDRRGRARSGVRPASSSAVHKTGIARRIAQLCPPPPSL
jgi:hypothetical protein